MEYLEDLEKEVKEIWPQSTKWRLSGGLPEWCIATKEGDVWFQYWQAPIHVEKYIISWMKIN